MRIVAKVGSSSLVDARGQRQLGLIGGLVEDVAATVQAGHQVVLVSSGAIAVGLGLLGREERPDELPALQAASAVGQGALFSTWSTLLDMRGVRAAQVLLTMHDAAHRTSWRNARNTLERLLAWGIVPIVNENDTTATDEITFGDNDMLAAQVAVALGASHLVLLTDTAGLFTAHPDAPGASLLRDVDTTATLRAIDTAGPGSSWGSGGMRSKVVAAEMASAGGVTSWIASAGEPGVVGRIADGQHVGTRVAAGLRRGSSFKVWLRHARRPAGVVRVDEGAERALVEGGASLLAIGVRAVDGDFRAGDVVDVARDGVGSFATGIVEYGSGELAAMVGSPETARGMREAIHRDQLAVWRDDPR